MFVKKSKETKKQNEKKNLDQNAMKPKTPIPRHGTAILRIISRQVIHAVGTERVHRSHSQFPIVATPPRPK